jgi:pimeloyl-ACP methyl ester carboxylesterase
MIESVASDVREALRALATSTPTDTSRYTLVATGESALPGLRAAERDRRVTSLVMLSAETPPLEWGPLRATIGRLRMPVFWSQSPEDYPLFDVYDECYQAGERRSSRVADVKGGGHGAWPFRSDTTAAPRLIRWLAEKRPPRAAPAPPPPSRRKG